MSLPYLEKCIPYLPNAPTQITLFSPTHSGNPVVGPARQVSQGQNGDPNGVGACWEISVKTSYVSGRERVHTTTLTYDVKTTVGGWVVVSLFLSFFKIPRSDLYAFDKFWQYTCLLSYKKLDTSNYTKPANCA